MWWPLKILGRTPRTILADLEKSPAFQAHLQLLADASALGGRERCGDAQPSGRDVDAASAK